jgi:hypothetical protein
MLARAIGDRMMQVRLLLQGNVVSVLDGIKAAAPGATVNYAQGCDTSCRSTTGFGAAVSVRAEDRIHGSYQQSCSPGVPPLMSTGHVLAVRVPPDHATNRVPPEYSIVWLTCAIASRLDAAMVGWPGAAQDRLPADGYSA